MQPYRTQATVPLRLNLGGGDVPLDGFVTVDRKRGAEIFPISWKDLPEEIPLNATAVAAKSDRHFLKGSVADEIYASHCLEHFSHADSERALLEWVRVLKPGGRIRIAVPDLDKIVEAYARGDELPIGGYLMGGQADENDYHKTVFNHERLAHMMTRAGLVDLKPWKSEIRDCASLPISLNLEGTKPLPGKRPVLPPHTNMVEAEIPQQDSRVLDVVPARAFVMPKTVAVMSMPRLAFTATMFCALDVCLQRKVKFEKVEGAFWHQCMTRIMEQHLDDGTEWLIAIDYDSVFTTAHFDAMVKLMNEHPEADAIAPLQFKRDENSPLMGVCNPDGSDLESQTVDLSFFNPPLTRCRWSHFGFTFIRVAALKRMAKPWFYETPAPDGTWNAGRLDADLGFWKNFHDSGNQLYLANHVGIGHQQLTVTWPGEDFKALHQYSGDYITKGVPKGARA